MKIVIVDDNDDFRESLRDFVEKRLGHEVIAAFNDGKSFYESYTKITPDIILMDISMPEMDGYKVTRLINWESSYLKVIAVTMYQNKAYLKKLIEVGFKGCVLKTNVFNDLPKAIKAVINGGFYWPDSIDVGHG
jgi:DNA-binding NarL/FixJ family response regulator